MVRILSPAQLLAEEIQVRGVECHRQFWRDGDGYDGYTATPRPRSGFVYVVSEMRAAYTFSDGKTALFRRGDLLFLPRGSRYTVRFTGGGDRETDSYTVNFDLYDSTGKEVRLPDLFRVRAGGGCRAAAEALCHAAWELPRNHLRLTAGFFSFLAAVIGEAPGREDSYYPIRRGAELFRAEWNQNKKIARYAAACGMSESHFYRRFRDCFGESPSAYRNRVRLLHAASLLGNTNLPVSEIAVRVGYEDPFYFSRCFHAAYGVSPVVYRQKRLGETPV